MAGQGLAPREKAGGSPSLREYGWGCRFEETPTSFGTFPFARADFFAPLALGAVPSPFSAETAKSGVFCFFDIGEAARVPFIPRASSIGDVFCDKVINAPNGFAQGRSNFEHESGEAFATFFVLAALPRPPPFGNTLAGAGPEFRGGVLGTATFTFGLGAADFGLGALVAATPPFRGRV